MKHIMPFFAACALLVGSACSTYTSTTDPIDTGSGTILSEEVATAAPAPEAHTPAAAATTPDTAATAPVPAEEAAH